MLSVRGCMACVGRNAKLSGSRRSYTPMNEAMMQLVEQHIIRREDKRFAVLDRACFHAKNIYNAANYELRQLYFAQRRRMNYAEQEKHFKQKDLLEDQELPMKVVQHVLK